MPDQDAPDGGYVKNSKQSHAAVPPQLVPFTKGDDPRRWKGGPIAKQIAAARDALSVHLPDAVKAFGELVHSADERIRLAAAAEICDRCLGKPRQTIDFGSTEVKTELDRQIQAYVSQLHALLTPEVRDAVAGAIKQLDESDAGE